MADLRLHGAFGAIYIGGPIGTGTRVAAKAQWTFNASRDTVEVTSFGDANKRYVAGLEDTSGTFAGFLDNDGDQILAAAGGDPVLIYLYSRESAPILVAYGSGYVDATVTVANNDAARLTSNWRAASDWTRGSGF